MLSTNAQPSPITCKWTTITGFTPTVIILPTGLHFGEVQLSLAQSVSQSLGRVADNLRINSRVLRAFGTCLLQALRGEVILLANYEQIFLILRTHQYAITFSEFPGAANQNCFFKGELHARTRPAAANICTSLAEAPR